MEPLLNSKQVMELMGWTSMATFIKYEELGVVEVHKRFGNRKRYLYPSD